MARTKGSKNGISRTKGYTAVGQRAKGRWVNGRYVYDLPKFSSGNTEMIRDGKVVYENPSLPAGVASYPKKKSDWAKEAASYDNHVTTYPKQGYDALMTEKRNAWLAGNARYQGAKNNWQQMANKAAAAGVRNAMVTTNAANAKKKNYQDTLAKGAAMGDAAKAADAQRKAEAKARWQAGNKAMAAKKAKEQGEKNNWQQQANAKRDDVETYRKYKQGYISGIASKNNAGGADVMQRPKNEKQAVNYTEIVPMTNGTQSAKGKLNNWQQMANQAASSGTIPKGYSTKQYTRHRLITEKNEKNLKKFGEKNNWQQQANAAQAKEAERRASIKAASEKGSKNNWQTIGNARRSNAELHTEVSTGKKSAAYVPTYSAGIRYFRENPKISTSEKGKNFVEVNDDAYTPNYKKELRNKAIAAGASKGDAAKALDSQRKAEAKARWNAANKAKKSTAEVVAKGASMNTAQQAAKAQAKAEAKKRWEEGAKAKAKAKAKTEWKERRKKLKYK